MQIQWSVFKNKRKMYMKVIKCVKKNNDMFDLYYFKWYWCKLNVLDMRKYVCVFVFYFNILCTLVF